MFGVVEADVDPQQENIYTTHKAAMIWTTDYHTAFEEWDLALQS